MPVTKRGSLLARALYNTAAIETIITIIKKHTRKTRDANPSGQNN